jgi:hypothetical protein
MKLTEKQRELLELFNSLSEKQQDKVLAYLLELHAQEKAVAR